MHYRDFHIVAVAARKAGIVDAAVDRFTAEATFACLTNVDFDPARFETWIKKTVQLRNDLRTKLEAAGGTIDSDAAALSLHSGNGPRRYGSTRSST